MLKYAEIVKKRSTPGILIFDMDENLLYLNPEVFDYLPSLDGAGEDGEHSVGDVPDEILDFYRSARENPSTPAGMKGNNPSSVIMALGKGNPYSLRALRVGNHGNGKIPTHIVILVEKVVERHEPDFDKAKIKYKLSKKELEVLKLVCQGFSNKAIGEKMFICVFTVKDHIKNLKRKIGASSRSEMVSLLK